MTTDPGAQMRHNQSDIVVFILRNEEWAWFAANAVMPVVPADVPATRT